MDASGSERLLPGSSRGAMAAAGDKGLGDQVGSSFPPPPSYPVGRDGGASDRELYPDDDHDGDFYDGEEEDEGDEEAILAELEDLDLDESQVEEALAILEMK
eukprot:8057520-Pyramimonas_sp.AAC.1